MKNKITVLFFGVLFCNIAVNAQISTGVGGAGSILPNSTTTNTNVGIGTTEPTAKLEVVGIVKAKEGEFFKSLPDGATYTDWKDRNISNRVLNLGTIRDPLENGRLLCFYDHPQSNIINLTKSAFVLTIDDRSNHTRFITKADTGGEGYFSLMDKNQTDYFKVYDYGNDIFTLTMPKPNTRVIIGGLADYANSLGHKLFVQGGSAKVEGNILTDANIGIGTSNFTDGSETYRLSVKGKVRAEEVKVYNTWADYVFAKNYYLKPLTKVEEYIAQNGHLPNVPSAKEITEKGLELGEMAKIQQEKIEELTLYLIQQNKEMEELKSQVKLLLAAQKK
ncbi:hypothetical protein DMB65_19535 [Flavobacterium cheongpyeongense]|uniref:Uncharacterized protein n=1 Tax=Flavobacterium cheongpyeongense TaxID=2212651 RepID=A0A2V4BKK3_9FLAO|nr:hypothetical protein [Flavobacterium cheongpyeongense]PXY39072.1 hypothetical protein DMB65_19535 [Flavobacterium cheongpyeongense]